MRTNRPYVQIDPDVLERVRQIDLLSYLREFEPSNLVKVNGTSNVYCTAEHDSLKISNGKWYWWSRGFGGYSALDYLIKVKEYDFVEAVEILTGQTMADWKPPPAPKKDEPKVLLLPPKNKDCNRVTQYLFRRGIDYQLIQECIADGTLYESADYHNAVFIGKDEGGTPKYAALRSTIGSTFKQDASGSDKRYSFRLLTKKPADTVHLFEAAIDLLSYATYLKCEGKDYKSESLLSLSGVYQPKKEMKDSKIPIALTTFLSANPQIKTIDKELANYESKLKEVDLNKARLEREIDNLPIDARFRERKIHDMTLRLDGLYDTIVELEERIEDAKLRKSSIEMEAITLDNIYKLMLNFGKLYDIISDEEKKSLITYLIKEIQIYPNGESEQPLKSIEFNFPIYRDGQEVRRLLWEKGNTVETVCLLSN